MKKPSLLIIVLGALVVLQAFAFSTADLAKAQSGRKPVTGVCWNGAVPDTVTGCTEGALKPSPGWKTEFAACINSGYVFFPVKADGKSCEVGQGTFRSKGYVPVPAASNPRPNPTPNPRPSPGSGGPDTGGNSDSGSNGGPAAVGCDDSYGTTKNGICVPHNPLGEDLEGIAGSGSIIELAAKIIDVLLYFAGIVAVVFVIIGGYQYMTARGSDEQSTGGRKTMTQAIIGLVIVILAYVIINAVVEYITK